MEQFRSFDGTAIAYIDRGDGPTVVLHHGFAADHATNWDAPGVVDALVEAGRRVVALDARGHGQSGKPHEEAAYADGAMAKDVRALFDHLDLDDVDLVGYSMGAIVAAQVTPSEPRVRTLLLGGIGAGALSGRRPRSWSGAVRDALLADDPSTVTDPTAKAFRTFADATGADRLALAAIQGGGGPEALPVGDIAVPTLVLVGEGDALVGDPRPLAEAIDSAECKVIGGDHLGAVGDPDFVPSVVEWVSRGR